MATDDQLTQYESDLKAYNSAVAANAATDARITELQTANADLQAKIDRLKTAQTTIKPQDDPIWTQIGTIGTGPDTEQFHGTLESNYWGNQKTSFKDELTKFASGVAGDGNTESIDWQLQKKITELEGQISTNNSAITTATNSKTSPTAPTLP